MRWCVIGRDGNGHAVELESFYKVNGNPMSYCKECGAVRRLVYLYDLPISEAWKIISGEQQCEIGGADCSNQIVQDHDHKTNQRRGILCATHNHGLGNFHDSIYELELAIAYLQKYGPQ